MTSSGDEPSRLDAISTRWSLLRRAHGESVTSAGEARNALVLRYVPAIRRYIGALLQNDEDADDVTHDVVVRLLGGDFAGADPARGRFRDLLKTAIRNMVRNRWAREKRRRSTGLDAADVAAEPDAADEARWTAEWRQSVLDLAWKALQCQEESRPGSASYTLLRLRADHPDDTSDELAARFSAATGRAVRADAVRQKLRRARLQFADLVIAEVGRALHDPTPEKIEDEIVALGLMELVRDLLPADPRGE
jgi:RNA polymerase sigma factor (sigma-70 family)